MALKDVQEKYDVTNREYQRELAQLQAKYLQKYGGWVGRWLGCTACGLGGWRRLQDRGFGMRDPGGQLQGLWIWIGSTSRLVVRSQEGN